MPGYGKKITFWKKITQAYVSFNQEIIFFLFFIVLLFICAYKAWVISSPCPHPLPYHPLPPLSQYPEETILPLPRDKFKTQSGETKNIYGSFLAGFRSQSSNPV
jgi:hypothetical protein